MIRRWLDGVVNAQAAWADPLGDLMQRIFKTLYGPFPALRDLLHGTWLGHPLHPALTDVPVGAFLIAFVLDLAGQSGGATVAIAVGFVTMLSAAATGYADYIDLGGTSKRVGTVHSTIMLIAAVLYFVSLGTRLGWWGATGTGLAEWTAAIGLVLVLVGAYLGGDLVFNLGSQVDRHAWRGGGTKWQALDVESVPEDRLTKAKAGAQTLVVVRRGETIYALHDTCAHQGCSLAEGKLIDNGTRIECKCHGSRFELADGSVNRGPAVFPQPRYEVRRAEGKIEVKRAG
ncbi:MAG TPA: Rieske 2Fe-2S domain-containing protein [Candidatus Limnocylindria bacterium]|nr:Rieske 2Fe-2S domain-containing protein [Candidatus Limnocylindria bacterium]